MGVSAIEVGRDDGPSLKKAQELVVSGGCSWRITFHGKEHLVTETGNVTMTHLAQNGSHWPPFLQGMSLNDSLCWGRGQHPLTPFMEWVDYPPFLMEESQMDSLHWGKGGHQITGEVKTTHLIKKGHVDQPFPRKGVRESSYDHNRICQKIWR
jgi:hypothetical protein